MEQKRRFNSPKGSAAPRTGSPKYGTSATLRGILSSPSTFWTGHAADYFDMEPTDRSAHTIATGFRQIKLSMEGKRFQNGKPTPVSTYKGWTLVAWEDGPSHKSHKK